MSHDVYTDQNSFSHIAMTENKPAWHKLGMYFPEGTLPSVAFETAKLNDIVVEKEHLYVMRDGEYQPLNDQMNLVRLPWAGDSERIDLGVVGSAYEPIQNLELGRIYDKLGKYANIDVVGALRKGAITFATFRGDYFSVLVNGKDDEHQIYLLAYEDKRPGNAIQFIFSPVRTVCANTVRAAMDQAEMAFSLSHNQGAAENTDWVITVLGQIASRSKAIQNAMQWLAKTKITDQQVQETIDFAWPLPPEPTKVRLGKLHFTDGESPVLMDEITAKRWESYRTSMDDWQQAVTRIERTRNFAIETYYGHPTQAAVIGTAHGAYNAVTYTCDHYGMGGSGVKVAEAVLNGSRVKPKLRAWDFLVSSN